MNISWHDKLELRRAITEVVQPSDLVLDVGCGIRPQNFCHPLVHICIEPYSEYVRELLIKTQLDPRFVILNGRWDQVCPLLPENSVDIVFALDFIEHLEKESGFAFLKEAKRIAKKQVVVYTPFGYYPQEYTTNSQDRWGLNGGEWQTHRSGWGPSDFGDEWQLFCCKNYHDKDQNGQKLDEPIGVIWAICDISPSHEHSQSNYTNMLSSLIKALKRSGIKNSIRVVSRSMRDLLRRKSP